MEFRGLGFWVIECECLGFGVVEFRGLGFRIRQEAWGLGVHGGAHVCVSVCVCVCVCVFHDSRA